MGQGNGTLVTRPRSRLVGLCSLRAGTNESMVTIEATTAHRITRRRSTRRRGGVRPSCRRSSTKTVWSPPSAVMSSVQTRRARSWPWAPVSTLVGVTHRVRCRTLRNWRRVQLECLHAGIGHLGSLGGRWGLSVRSGGASKRDGGPDPTAYETGASSLDGDELPTAAADLASAGYAIAAATSDGNDVSPQTSFTLVGTRQRNSADPKTAAVRQIGAAAADGGQYWWIIMER